MEERGKTMAILPSILLIGSCNLVITLATNIFYIVLGILVVSIIFIGINITLFFGPKNLFSVQTRYNIFKGFTYTSFFFGGIFNAILISAAMPPLLNKLFVLIIGIIEFIILYFAYEKLKKLFIEYNNCEL